MIQSWNVHTGNLMNLWRPRRAKAGLCERSCSECSSVTRDWLHTVLEVCFLQKSDHAKGPVVTPLLFIFGLQTKGSMVHSELTKSIAA